LAVTFVICCTFLPDLQSALMIYTYHYGVLCVQCGTFINLGPYTTPAERGPHAYADPTVTVRCWNCNDTSTYPNAEVVSSYTPKEYVPLVA
jgi:hypothetical protein